MPFTSTGQTIVGKSPIHTQLVIVDPKGGATIYIPVKSFSWTKDTEQNDNLHSGSPLPSDLIDGHHKYSLSWETGTWLTTEVGKENAEMWEWLAYKYLVRPYDSGRNRVITVMHKQSSYYDDEDEAVGAGNIVWFNGCKVRKMGFSQGENGINKRTYEAGAKRMTYGNGQQEEDMPTR
jgi:hypothetical protein